MKAFGGTTFGAWVGPGSLSPRRFTCGFCSVEVSSILGWSYADGTAARAVLAHCYVCPHCHGLTVFDVKSRQYPAPLLGNPVFNVPEVLASAYQEARACTGQGCYTAAVLLCRKMLMNIAVEKGADAGETFAYYIQYLSDANYVPPGGKAWVDHIRKKGNEATHQIAIMVEKDARDLLLFVGQLLRFIYEFPAMLNPPVPIKS